MAKSRNHQDMEQGSLKQKGGETRGKQRPRVHSSPKLLLWTTNLFPFFLQREGESDVVEQALDQGAKWRMSWRPGGTVYCQSRDVHFSKTRLRSRGQSATFATRQKPIRRVFPLMIRSRALKRQTKPESRHHLGKHSGANEIY